MNTFSYIWRYIKTHIDVAMAMGNLQKRFPDVLYWDNITIRYDGDNLKIGSGTEICQNTIINCGGQEWCDYKGYFKCGKNCYIGPGSVIFAAGEIEMGDHTLLSPGVNLISHQHGYTDKTLPYNCQPNRYGKITLGNNVWIGTNATILPGVTIGDNAIVGANALVNKDVPANTIVAGVPAREIKKI